MLAAVDDAGGLFGDLGLHAAGYGVVGGCDHVAEDTVFIFGCGPVGERGRDAGAGLLVGTGDVAVAPGGPEAIHIWASIAGACVLPGALGGMGVLEGDSVGMDDMAVKMLAREGGLVDVSGSKFYDFR